MYELIRSKTDKALRANIDRKKVFLVAMYKTLCRNEGIKAAKDVDFTKENESFFEVRTRRIFGVPISRRRKIRIKNDPKWPVYLFHEVAHQIRYEDDHDTSHGQEFDVIYRLLLTKYFDRFISVFYDEKL